MNIFTAVPRRPLPVVLSRLLRPRGRDGSRCPAGPAAPPAPRDGRAGLTPCLSGGRSSAWRPEPPEQTGTASSACWERGRSLRLQGGGKSSD